MKNEVSTVEHDLWNPVQQQQLFRSLLHAYSYPGRIQTCTAEASLALLGSLLDGQSTLADPQALLPESIWSKLEARRVCYEQAAFILLDGNRPPEQSPNLGTLEEPEHGATLVLRVTALHEKDAGTLRLKLSGPGIRQPLCIGVDGLHAEWIAARNEWVSDFPLGVELLLCDAHHFVALPRTTRIELGGTA